MRTMIPRVLPFFGSLTNLPHRADGADRSRSNRQNRLRRKPPPVPGLLKNLLQDEAGRDHGWFMFARVGQQLHLCDRAAL